MVQCMIYLATKMKQSLIESTVKRGPAQKSYEHLVLFVFERVGMDILSQIGAQHRVSNNGEHHEWEDLDWNIFVQHVGIQNVAKKVSDNLFYYVDIQMMTYNKKNHTLTMHFVPCRWNGKEHRHRNVPLLLSQCE